ncbi:unnamed protein product [Rotaria sp. Silwood2]|nr:unnamed protein product [Rotaria sp. Silwood2]CAF4143794.1 unnamed protein product [Rotaria sp. Silwood2]
MFIRSPIISPDGFDFAINNLKFDELVATTTSTSSTSTTTPRPIVSITRSDDAIVSLYNTAVDGSTGASNGRYSILAEEPPAAIDGSLSTKYLNFEFQGTTGAVLNSPGVNTGFYVTPTIGNDSVAVALLFATANDYPSRDPIKVTLEETNATRVGALDLVYILMAIPIMAISPGTVINGLIEGFYWSNSDAVQGQANFYSKQQRDNLISLMGNGLNYYIFCPHETANDAFTMTLWNAQQILEWSDTISKASNISIVFGLRPGWIDNVQTSLQKIQLKLKQLASVGIRYYILCWDDSPGAGTNAQMKLQRDLIKALVNQVTNIELIGIIPAYYSRSQISSSTNIDWGKQLVILNEIPSSIRFFVTGSEVNPSSIQISDIPSLNNRQFIFFDNWIAVDSNSRVTMTWPPNRDPNIYHASKSISGSVLNLAFPPQRIIHQIYALKQRINNQYANIQADLAAGYWAKYLVAKNFYNSNSLEQLKTDLTGLINDGLETNEEIIQQYPFLSTIFIN